MKARRHMKILQILRDKDIGTQEELAKHLRDDGIEVTQATISRDIKELRLTKMPTGDGTYRYALPDEELRAGSLERVRRLLRDSVISLDQSENLVVVKTLPGNAHAVASVIDGLRWAEVVGTVAGDDTIVVVARDKANVPEIIGRLERLMD